MSYFQYYLETESVAPNPDRPPPLVIQVKSLSLKTLEQLPLFLIENIALIHDIEGINTHLNARPVEVELQGGAIIKEKLIWMMVLQCLPDALTLMVKYVEAHLARITEEDELGWCSYLDVVGQEALYAYFDSHEELSNSEEHLKLIDCFIIFYKRCDLEHYYLPNRYVRKILDIYFFDYDRFVNLLYYFVLNDQDAIEDYELMHRYLSRDGVLKVIVDLRIEEGGLDSWGGMLDILSFCAPVYGSQHELTDYVLKYCKEKYENFGCEEHALKNFQSSLKRTQSKCDSDWVSRKIGSKYTSLNTGFHKYDGEHDQWICL